MTAVLDTLALLAAHPLDVGNLSLIPLGNALGRLAAGLAGRLLRLSPERLSLVSDHGATVGGACGLFLCLATYLL